MNENRASGGPNWGLLLLIPAAVIVAKGAMRRRAMWEAAWATDPGSAGHPTVTATTVVSRRDAGQAISLPRSGCRRRSSGCSTRGTPVPMRPPRRPMRPTADGRVRPRPPTRRTPASRRPSETADYARAVSTSEASARYRSNPAAMTPASSANSGSSTVVKLKQDLPCFRRRSSGESASSRSAERVDRHQVEAHVALAEPGPRDVAPRLALEAGISRVRPSGPSFVATSRPR